MVTTVPTRKGCERIALALVEKKLAGCVQVCGPVTSIYPWKGKINRSKEFFCFIKTKKSLYKKVETEIKRLHSYQVPEIISFGITDGSAQYLRWLGKYTR